MQVLLLETTDKHILGSNHRIKMYATIFFLAIGIGNGLNSPTFQTDNLYIGINILNSLQ